MLPASSLCLVVPVVPPSHYDMAHAREQEEEARQRLQKEEIDLGRTRQLGGLRMKIGKIETFYVPPRWLFVRVEADEGAVGWGEASLEGHAEAVDGAFEALRDRFIGHDPFRIEDIWQIGYRGGFYRGGPVLMSALAGLEQALWDLKGRALSLPAWEMLGGRVRDKVRAYAWIGGDRPHEIADAAKARGEQGFSAVKMNATAELGWIGTPKMFDEVVARVEAAQARRNGRRARLPRPRPPADGEAAGQGARAARPAVHRGAAAVGESGRARADREPRQHADRARRAALFALGLQALLRERRGRHHPAGPEPRRRHPRMPQDRGDGGGL